MSGPLHRRPHAPPAGVDGARRANHTIFRGPGRVLLCIVLAIAATSPVRGDAPDATRDAWSEALDRLEATVTGEPVPPRRPAATVRPPPPSGPVETRADGLEARLAGTRLAPGESLTLDVSTAWPAAWIYVDVLTPDGRAIHGGRPRRLSARRTATIRIGTDAGGPDASLPGAYRLVVLALDRPQTALGAVPAIEPVADAVTRLRRALQRSDARRLALRILPFELCPC